MSVSMTVELSLEPDRAFDVIVDELVLALGRLGMKLVPGPNGQVFEGTQEVGHVTSWNEKNELAMEWQSAPWQQPEKSAKLVINFTPIMNGTRVMLQINNWNNIVENPNEFAGWFSTEILAPVFKTIAPDRYSDWYTDRRARRPTGLQARDTYRDPTHHRPNFYAILDVLKLQPTDYLLEVGCGGGAFLQDALRSDCRAAAVDHSPEMVRLAREVNKDAIAQNRLVILEAEADTLPYSDEMFTCAVMTSVFGFLPKPLESLDEIFRTLRKGGRLVMFTTSKEVKGTIAAPEPIASKVHFYEDKELEELARKAGFREVHVDRPDLGPYARKAKLPEDIVAMFSSGRDGQLLVARKV